MGSVDPLNEKPGGVGEFMYTKLMGSIFEDLIGLMFESCCFNLAVQPRGQAFKSVWCCWWARTVGDQCDKLRFVAELPWPPAVRSMVLQRAPSWLRERSRMTRI